jgi:hypothetical protein
LFSGKFLRECRKKSGGFKLIVTVPSGGLRREGSNTLLVFYADKQSRYSNLGRFTVEVWETSFIDTPSKLISGVIVAGNDRHKKIRFFIRQLNKNKEHGPHR